MPGPLDGIRVIDLTQGLCGPFATLRLGDAGADVVKLEPPNGDAARRMGPPFLGDESALFLALNRNKRSVVVDLESGPGRATLARLLTSADVLVEDLGAERMAELGLDPAGASAAHPELVICSISAYGDSGPLADQPGAELVIQAMAEYTRSLGRIGEPPVRVGADVANLNTAIFASQAVIGALLARARTGRGQRVAVSMLGSLLHLRGIMWAAMSDPDDWWGFHLDHYTNPPETGYETGDGRIFFGLRRGDSEDFDKLMLSLGLQDHTVDERFGHFGRDAAPLGRHAVEAKPVWESAFKQRKNEELLLLFNAVGGDAVPYTDYAEIASHPQVRAIAALCDVDSGNGDTFRTVRAPWRLPASPASVRRGPPKLGQHTQEILREAGIEA